MVGAFALTNGHGAFAAARIRRATLGWRTVAVGAAGPGGFLEVVVGRVALVQLRLLRITAGVVSRGPKEQAGLHLPQVAAKARTAAARSGMRLGRAHLARRGQLRGRDARTHPQPATG